MSMPSNKAIGLFLIALFFARPAVADEAVAMVTDVSGSATVTEDGNAAKLALLAYLMPKDQIRLENGAKVVITFFTKPQEFVFNGPAKIEINADGPKVLTGSAAETHHLGQEKASAARKFSAMQRENLAQATFEMREGKPGLRLIGPVDTAVISTLPRFAWAGVKNASYHFVLIGGDGKTIRETKTTEPGIELSGKNPLKPGHAYEWKVETHLATGETLSASGKFTVMDEKKAIKISQARPKPGADFSERVLYAAMMEAEGAKYEAAQEWRALAKERPDDPVLQDKAER